MKHQQVLLIVITVIAILTLCRLFQIDMYSFNPRSEGYSETAGQKLYYFNLYDAENIRMQRDTLLNSAKFYLTHLNVSIINQPNCSTPNPEILFLVHSAPGHFAHRKIFRDTVGAPSLSTSFNWKVVFVLGLTPAPDVNKAILQESIQYGDLVILPYMDTYRNLTIKFVHGIRWILTSCPSINTVVKVDDDIFINVFEIMKYIRDNVSHQERMFHCRTWIFSPVHRSTKSPWFVQRNAYPDDFYPPYCSGALVIFGSHLLKDLYRASFLFPYISVDDAYVTGILAVVARIGHRNMTNRMTYSVNKIDDVVKGKLIFAHMPGTKNMKLRTDSWTKMLKTYNVTF